VVPIPVRGLSISRPLGVARRQGVPLSTAAEAFTRLLLSAYFSSGRDATREG
jgi:hypothetical protein